MKGHLPVKRAGKTSSFHCLLFAIAAAVVGPNSIDININKNIHVNININVNIYMNINMNNNNIIIYRIIS